MCPPWENHLPHPLPPVHCLSMCLQCLAGKAAPRRPGRAPAVTHRGHRALRTGQHAGPQDTSSEVAQAQLGLSLCLLPPSLPSSPSPSLLSLSLRQAHTGYTKAYSIPQSSMEGLVPELTLPTLTTTAGEERSQERELDARQPVECPLFHLPQDRNLSVYYRNDSNQTETASFLSLSALLVPMFAG